MYTNESYQQNRAQLRNRFFACGLPVLALFILMLVSFFMRWAEALTVILSILTFGLGVLLYGMFITPVVAYGKHLYHALNGRTRKLQGKFVMMEEEAVGRDGVMFYPFTVNVGDKGLEEDDRLFYMDANLPHPEWNVGDKLEITSFDNRVVAWEIIA